MDRFRPTGKVPENEIHLSRRTTFLVGLVSVRLSNIADKFPVKSMQILGRRFIGAAFPPMWNSQRKLSIFLFVNGTSN